MPQAPILPAAPAAEPTPIASNPSPQAELPLEAHPIAPPQADPALQTPPTGQLLLGTDKRNPVFAVYEDDSGERLLVFYGFELIEIVKNDSADPAFKLLLARLYNSKVKLSALCESFQVDPKTIRRWGKALLRGDPAELVRVLEGRSACHKLTSAVENFARLRWPDLVAERSYGAVGRLLLEIQSVFGLEISRSGLQSLIRILKGGPAPEPSSLVQEVPPSSLPSPKAGAELPAQQGAQGPQQTRESSVKSLEQPPADRAPDSAVQPSVPAGTPSGNNAHPSPFFPKDPAQSLYWCDHAGVLVFATALAAISQVSPTPQRILSQWMAALLLGAQNIEQTKYLNWEDLELILGEVVRFPTPQRDQLKALAADPGLLDKLWRFNQTNLGPVVGSDFYFDPHTKHYTGEQNVLKGWCPKIRGADKVLHSDFIHTAQGAPIYFETTDNFADLRQRFGGVIGRARQALQWPDQTVPTFVVDRGIYGAEFFEQVAGDPTFHLITWQKGFTAQPWDPAQVMGQTTITRSRNSSTDVRLYHFEYIERAWEKNALLRQIVVQATDYKGRTIQVAILTDDLKRAAIQIIQLMFQRWLQENDFKYLDKHFGINQIDSYRSIEYEKLKGQVEDREVKSAARKALDLKLKQVTEPLKRHLLAEEQAHQAHQLRALKGPELAAKLALESVKGHARRQRTEPASGGAQGRRSTLRDDASGTTQEHRARPQRHRGPSGANRRDPSPGIAFGSDDPGPDGENGGPVQAAHGCSEDHGPQSFLPSPATLQESLRQLPGRPRLLPQVDSIPRSDGSASPRNSDSPDATNQLRRRAQESGHPNAGGDQCPGTGASVSARKKVEVPAGATIGDGVEDERGGLKPSAESAPAGLRWAGSRQRPAPTPPDGKPLKRRDLNSSVFPAVYPTYSEVWGKTHSFCRR